MTLEAARESGSGAPRRGQETLTLPKHNTHSIIAFCNKETILLARPNENLKLRDGQTVAVKRMYENNYKRVEQFMNEIDILSRLRYQNFISLYGCTSRHCRELLLVYKFVPNGTVADHLHGPRVCEQVLAWPTRMQIAIKTAKALGHLLAVEPPILHRDVKTNNTLLDVGFHVKGRRFQAIALVPNECIARVDHAAGHPGLRRPIVPHIQRSELAQQVDPTLGYDSDWVIRKTITMVARGACL
ncbi:putative serine/threonine-protein kinase [Ananas comosus]|uniref:Putative serine/threonine-protein kinase n=1 Tax=Ananas comosus TaxID=4615 RepID=A0A199UVW3_ANACO|nr:putative serine/threonine-protein kinase [Ananas comosus]